MVRAAAIVATLFVSATAAAPADAQLPVGESNGVRVYRVHGAIVVKFTAPAAKLFRRVAGKRVSVFCTDLPEGDGIGAEVVASGGTTFRAPRRGRTLRTGDLTPDLDYCRVWLAARTVKRRGNRRKLSREHIVSVPVTQAGAVFLDEEFKALALMGTLAFANFEADRRNSATYPTAQELLETFDQVGRPPHRYGIVALAGASDTPPPGVVGYYSDGQRHVAAVMLSASGRRLFIDVNADVFSSNVSDFLFDPLE